MNKKICWVAIIEHSVKVGEKTDTQTTEIHVTEMAGVAELEVRFPNVWEMRLPQWYSYYKFDGASHVYLSRSRLTTDGAIKLAESCIASSNTLLDLIRDLAGKDFPDLPDGFDDISCVYKFIC